MQNNFKGKLIQKKRGIFVIGRDMSCGLAYQQMAVEPSSSHPCLMFLLDIINLLQGTQYNNIHVALTSPTGTIEKDKQVGMNDIRM